MEKSFLLDAQTPRKKRPFGVWFWTIAVGFGAGLVPPMLLAIMYWRSREVAAMISPLHQALSLVTSIVVISTAVGAWRGSRAGRFAFVGITAYYYLGTTLIGIVLLSTGAAQGIEASTLGKAGRGILVTACVAWYFLASRSARDFYDTSSSLAERGGESPSN
jgi:hypothetical protein